MILKKFFLIVLLTIPLLLPQFSLAARGGAAANLYTEELVKAQVPAESAQKKASQEAEDLFKGMEAAQADLKVALGPLDTRIKALHINDGRKDAALKAMGKAEEKVGVFVSLKVEDEYEIQKGIAGVLPRLLPSADFEQAQKEATDALSEVNRVLIDPDRPGIVPAGDLVSDFIPQLIRQLFRFAWVVILISFTVSGLTFILARDNEERVTNAKTMIYYSIIGFVFIALSFALVKGITNIDFFGFI